MSSRIRLFIGVMSVLSGILGCGSHHSTKPEIAPTVRVEDPAARKKSGLEGRASVVELEFRKNSAHVSRRERLKILSALQMPNLKFAKVMTWSDREHPDGRAEKLSFDEADLAKRRSEEIQKILKKQFASTDIELYNMAQRPGPFSEFVAAADPRIKFALERAGVSTTNDHATPKARKSILIFLTEEPL